VSVLLHNAADKYLKRLNAKDRERIKEALRDLAKDPPEGDDPMKAIPEYCV
jgi:mRNA-degrading endonuclease RelE of RelBE toxin-antitoxin system